MEATNSHHAFVRRAGRTMRDWLWNAGAVLHVFDYVWPQITAANENAEKTKSQKWTDTRANQRHLYKKLVGIE